MIPRVVREVPADTREVPLWIHPEWVDDLPWLVHGVTGRGTGEPFDLGLFGQQPAGRALNRWRALRDAFGMSAAIHSRQMHGSRVAAHLAPPPEGLVVMEGADGHATHLSGVLLTVTVADCVPVSLADPVTRTVAAVHAGWKGVAAGILERAIEVMADEWAVEVENLHMHLGPAICGECYEVGPEVHRAIHPDRSRPEEPGVIDLRAALAERAAARGASAGRITVSGHCTRCGPGDFFSHRGGDAGRQVSVVAIR